MKTAFVFPAFVTEYLGNEPSILENLSAGLPQFLAEASKITGEDYTRFSIKDPAFTEDELRSQIITYTFSCCLADALITKGLQPDFLAGYSMGLYAAIYTGGVICFKDGLRLIKQAYRISREVTEGIDSGMGSVIGLTAEEITTIIRQHGLETEIANINSEHAHLVTGRTKDLNLLLDLAQKEGALRVSLLPVKVPYHSQLLSETQAEFKAFIADQITLQQAKYPLVSSINQRIFSSTEETAKELTDNLFQKLNWHRTFKTMLLHDAQHFIECGAGKSLYNISRFVPGDFKVYPMHKVQKLYVDKNSLLRFN